MTAYDAAATPVGIVQQHPQLHVVEGARVLVWRRRQSDQGARGFFSPKRCVESAWRSTTGTKEHCRRCYQSRLPRRCALLHWPLSPMCCVAAVPVCCEPHRAGGGECRHDKDGGSKVERNGE